MAIGRVEIDDAIAKSVLLGGVIAGSAIRKGASIGIAEVTGVTAVYEVSSSSNARAFCGFAFDNYSIGSTVRVLSMRSSTITPIIQGGLGLTSGGRVFLSTVLGEITETVPTGAGTVVLQVGVASSTTDIILLTDFRVG